MGYSNDWYDVDGDLFGDSRNFTVQIPENDGDLFISVN